MDLHALIGAVFGPALVAAVLLFLARLARGRCIWFESPAWPACAIALAVVASARDQLGGLPWPPRIALESVPWVVCAAALAACVMRNGSWMQRRNADHRTWPALVSASAVVVASFAMLKLPSTSTSAVLAAVGLSVLSACVSAQAAVRNPGAAIPVALWGTGAALAALALMASIAKLALIMGAFSACAAAIAVLALVQRPMQVGAPVAGVWCAMLGTAAMLGMAYDEAGLPSIVWWLALASPLGCGLALVPSIAARPRLASAVRALAPIVVVVVALVIAAASIAASTGDPADADPSPYDAYGMQSPR
ncbi:MAG: hypothetical protein JNK53_04610 [Phycisphaerae bacterium]|nr:hypothetical protein [Phycisphaerae bacterium]